MILIIYMILYMSLYREKKLNSKREIQQAECDLRHNCKRV